MVVKLSPDAPSDDHLKEVWQQSEKLACQEEEEWGGRRDQSGSLALTVCETHI